MNINITHTSEDLKVSADIITLNVETHSALSEVPKDVIDEAKRRIRLALEQLLAISHTYRKVTG